MSWSAGADAAAVVVLLLDDLEEDDVDEEDAFFVFLGRGGSGGEGSGGESCLCRLSCIEAGGSTEQQKKPVTSPAMEMRFSIRESVLEL